MSAVRPEPASSDSDKLDSGKDPLRMLDDYDFELPVELIAQRPAPTRESARLLVLDRASGAVIESHSEHRVRALPGWLREGDLLVVNATRVLAARLVGRKASGGAAEALLLEPEAGSQGYRALLKCSGRVREGLELDFGHSEAMPAIVEAMHGRGEVTLRFAPGTDPYAEGQAPLPPYIQRMRDDDTDRAFDEERYQTVFAREPGAIAAPTAGLHLSESLLAEIDQAGVERAEVILHVGAGTFRPLDREALLRGRLHEERFVLPSETAQAIARTRARGGRVIAVGTTTARVLESRAADGGLVEAGAGTTDLFLHPDGPPFRVVDGLLTNFHLPRSSLLLLVAAFIGREPLLSAYRLAIDAGFRFYSYGDAMLILANPEESADG